MVSRTRLLARLAADAATDVVLVCAPAGYGKTTLLAEWARSLRQNGVAVTWYALDASDNAPGAFGAYLVAGLAEALGSPPALTHAAQRLRAAPDVDLTALLPPVINALAAGRREYTLILDDYHLIGAPAIHSALALMIERMPDNLRIVIGSRSDPPLPLARLRSQGRLREIRANDLQFTAAETETFLNEVMQLALPPEQSAALAARTEGWVAGLQLAALSLAGRTDPAGCIAEFSGSQRYLVEYLMEEVLVRQSADVQSFLLFTSILERLCAPLCDALLAEEPDRDAMQERPQPPASAATLAQLSNWSELT